MCKNKRYFSSYFKQIAPEKYEYLNYGQIGIVRKKILVATNKSTVPKELVPISKDYTLFAVFCEQCGEKIDRIAHSKVQKRSHNKWTNYLFKIAKKEDIFINADDEQKHS